MSTQVQAKEQTQTKEEKVKRRTETELIVLVIESLRTDLKLSDQDIKKSLKKINSSLPRSFPEQYGGKRKNVKLPGQPNAAKNAYLIFGEEVRPQLEEKGIISTAIMVETGKLWKKVSDTDKEKYKALAKTDKIRHKTEMAKFRADHPELIAASKPTKPIKMNAYNIYCTENREKVQAENKSVAPKEINNMLRDLWKSVKEQPNDYQAKADAKNVDYEQRLTEYNNLVGSVEESKESKPKESKESKPKESKESKPKESKPKETKSKETKSKETKTKETKDKIEKVAKVAKVVKDSTNTEEKTPAPRKRTLKKVAVASAEASDGDNEVEGDDE